MTSQQMLTARLAKDGRRVMCGARQPNNPTRFTCRGELGQVVWKCDEDDVLDANSAQGDFWRFHRNDGPLFEIANGFRFECQDSTKYPPDGFFRRSDRPIERTDKHLRSVMPDDGEPPGVWGEHYDEDNPQPWKYRWSEETGQRLFSKERKYEEFALPIKIHCPLCKRLNLATIALLESATPSK